MSSPPIADPGARLVLGWSALGRRLGRPWSAGRVLGWATRRRG